MTRKLGETWSRFAWTFSTTITPFFSTRERTESCAASIEMRKELKMKDDIIIVLHETLFGGVQRLSLVVNEEAVSVMEFLSPEGILCVSGEARKYVDFELHIQIIRALESKEILDSLELDPRW